MLVCVGLCVQVRGFAGCMGGVSAHKFAGCAACVCVGVLQAVCMLCVCVCVPEGDCRGVCVCGCVSPCPRCALCVCGGGLQAVLTAWVCGL